MRHPAVFATLLDEEQYLCSERSMYRILAENQPVHERRNQLQHPDYAKPELYVRLDLFSRYVVGWMVADRENSAPHDNPFSEAQFKTLKYHPGFPGRFLGIANE